MVVVFARDGVSTPEVYTDTLSDAALLKQIGRAESLLVQGQRQLYNLGRAIRDEYPILQKLAATDMQLY